MKKKIKYTKRFSRQQYQSPITPCGLKCDILVIALQCVFRLLCQGKVIQTLLPYKRKKLLRDIVMHKHLAALLLITQHVHSRLLNFFANGASSVRSFVLKVLNHTIHLSFVS